MSTIKPIKIGGLREFQAALKAMDGEAQKQLRVVLNDAAATVAGAAGRRVPVRSGKARASLRAQSSQREAKVVGGSAKVPYYGWLDFGGKVGKHRSVSRRFVTEGRYMYPAFHANRDSIYAALQAALVELARSKGVTVDGG